MEKVTVIKSNIEQAFARGDFYQYPDIYEQRSLDPRSPVKIESMRIHELRHSFDKLDDRFNEYHHDSLVEQGYELIKDDGKSFHYSKRVCWDSVIERDVVKPLNEKHNSEVSGLENKICDLKGKVDKANNMSFIDRIKFLFKMIEV